MQQFRAWRFMYECTLLLMYAGLSERWANGCSGYHAHRHHAQGSCHHPAPCPRLCGAAPDPPHPQGCHQAAGANLAVHACSLLFAHTSCCRLLLSFAYRIGATPLLRCCKLFRSERQSRHASLQAAGLDVTSAEVWRCCLLLICSLLPVLSSCAILNLAIWVWCST